MKHRREFSIAMVLVGLVGVNFFYLFVRLFHGLYDALFLWKAQTPLDPTSATLVIPANIMALMGLFYLVRPQAVGSTGLQGDRV